ncbi:MAG TPA: type II secretion system F family protein [Candidatus Competibacter sp.]|nr:type II secretion system F family protein [Candidatus Competibacter sp.]
MELTARQRGRLFSQLAAMERAGILPARAFGMIGGDLPSEARRGLERTAAALAKGAEIARAGQSNGVWLPWEARLLRAAGAGGRLEALYRRLSEHYAGRAKLWDRLKSRLLPPFLILILAALVAPFPALFQGGIGPGGYLLRAAGPPLLLYGALRVLVFAHRRQQAGETAAPSARMLSALPVLGGLLARQQRRDGVFSLLLLLESGVPVLDALPLAGESLADPLWRARFAFAAAALADGRSAVAETLHRYGVVDDPDAVASLAGGEAAGRLDRVLAHQLRQWDAQLEHQWETLAEWAPRLFYAAVAIWMAAAIIGGYRPMTVLD